jgi:hypothetical protein
VGINFTNIIAGNTMHMKRRRDPPLKTGKIIEEVGLLRYPAAPHLFVQPFFSPLV